MKIQGPSQALRETNEKLSKLPPKPFSAEKAQAQVIQHLSEAKLEILKIGKMSKPA